MKTGIKCEIVCQEISGYVDGTIGISLRRRMDLHFETCEHCKAVLNGTRKVVKLVSDKKAFEVPEDLSRRPYSKRETHLQTSFDQGKPAKRIPFGITDDRVQLGSHLIHFWESDEEFKRGVRFLYPGLGQGEHCIIFGHDEALEKVLEAIRSSGYDSQQLIRDLDLTVIRRQASAQATLSDIGDLVRAAMSAGATAVRFLGNLGMGRGALPGGEDDLLELESQVTTLIAPLPAVVVCMYDVRTVSGRLILKGGLQAHRLAVCSHGVEENPYYVPEAHVPPGDHAIQ